MTRGVARPQNGTLLLAFSDPVAGWAEATGIEGGAGSGPTSFYGSAPGWPPVREGTAALEVRRVTTGANLFNVGVSSLPSALDLSEHDALGVDFYVPNSTMLARIERLLVYLGNADLSVHALYAVPTADLTVSWVGVWNVLAFRLHQPQEIQGAFSLENVAALGLGYEVTASGDQLNATIFDAPQVWSFDAEADSDRARPTYLADIHLHRQAQALVPSVSAGLTVTIDDAQNVRQSVQRAKVGSQAVVWDKSLGTDTISGLQVSLARFEGVIEDFDDRTNWTVPALDAGPALPGNEHTQGEGSITWAKPLGTNVASNQSRIVTGLGVNLEEYPCLLMDIFIRDSATLDMLDEVRLTVAPGAHPTATARRLVSDSADNPLFRVGWNLGVPFFVRAANPATDWTEDLSSYTLSLRTKNAADTFGNQDVIVDNLRVATGEGLAIAFNSLTNLAWNTVGDIANFAVGIDALDTYTRWVGWDKIPGADDVAGFWGALDEMHQFDIVDVTHARVKVRIPEGDETYLAIWFTEAFGNDRVWYLPLAAYPPGSLRVLSFDLTAPDLINGAPGDIVDLIAVGFHTYDVAHAYTGAEIHWITFDYPPSRYTAAESLDLSGAKAVATHLYLPSLENVRRVSLSLQDSASDESIWYCRAPLLAGWNAVSVGIEQTPDEGTVVDLTEIDFLGVRVETLFDADLLDSIALDQALSWDSGACRATTHHGIWGLDTAVEHDDPLLLPALLQLPATTSQSTDPEQGRTTISGASFALLDTKDDALLDLVGQNELRGCTVRLFLGFPSLHVQDWRLVGEYTIHSLAYEETLWSFMAKDALLEMKAPLMASASVAAPVTLQGNLITLWLQMLTSTGTGLNGPYDVLPVGQGVGFPIERLDLETIESERDDWLSAWTVEFEFEDLVEDFKAWADQEVFALTGAILRVKNGLVSIKASRVPLPLESLVTFDDSLILKRRLRQVYSTDRLYNQVRFLYDYDPATNQFGNALIMNSDEIISSGKTSQELFGAHPLTLGSRGVKSALTTLPLTLRGRGLFRRYKRGTPLLNLPASLRQYSLAPGDVVFVELPRLPDLKEGTRGTSGIYQVLASAVEHSRGQVDLTLASTTYEQRRYSVISPSSITHDYDDATTSQKLRYAWIATTANTLGINDDEPYVIIPM